MLRTLMALVVAIGGTMLAWGPLAAQGNVPRIQSLNPSSILVGEGGFTLTVSGANFREGAVIRWNGDDRPTTFVDQSQLRATIPTGDLARAGTSEVTVFVSLGQGRVSSPVTFTINNPRPSISSLSPSSAGAGGASIALVLEGTDFVEGARVTWNGSARPTTRISATRVRTSIPAADLATPGIAKVTVVNPGPGGGPSATSSFSAVHQTPGISSLEPDRVTQGQGDFTLRVRGNDFLPSSSTVLWKGAERPTRFVSATELHASIPAPDIANVGTANVAVRTVTGGSTRVSSPLALTIALAPQQSAVATLNMPTSITAFYVGGSHNPERVFASEAVPLHIVHTGGTPTHWRAAVSANGIRSAAWQTMGSPPTHTFSPYALGERTLYFQFRRLAGRDSTLSNIVSDAVTVRRWSTAGIVPAVYGRTTSSRHRLECPTGEFMTGVRARQGNWIDAIGPVCAGRNRPMVGNLQGGEERTNTCSSQTPAEIRLWDGLGPTPLWAVVTFPFAVARNPAHYVVSHDIGGCKRFPDGQPRFDPLRAWPVAGTRVDHTLECPRGAFPIGLEAHTDNALGGGVAGLGLICVQPD